jgi:PAS domain S-box-containing protein
VSEQTEFTEAERQAREAQAYAESIVQTIREPLLILDDALRVRSANRSFYQNFGVTPEQTENRVVYELGNGQWDIPLLRQLLEDILPKNSHFHDLEMEHDFPDIGRRTMRLNARKLYRPGNHVLMLLLAIEDITERRGAERARSLSETRYRRLFEAARDGILLLDVGTGRIVDANPYMTELLGYTHADFVGKSLWEIGLFEDEEGSRSAFQQLREQGYIRYEDLPLETRGGALREVEFVSNVYEENGGAIIQCNIRDITERKREADALRAAHVRLEIAYARERRITEALQRPLTLEVAPDTFPGLSVATLYESALSEAEVGGDFFDAFALPRGRVALAVADASGKGLGAAARTLQVKDVLRAFAREYPHAAEAIVARLNDFVCATRHFDDAGDEGFVCLTLAILDPTTGAGAVVSAGCEPPLLVRARGGAAEVIKAPGLPLGIESGELYQAMPFCLAAGDTILFVTDGITEARSDGELLGYEGLTDLAARALAAVPPESNPTALRSVATAILEGARAFGGGMLRDDACLLLARRR